ncbi:hypothetical protein [Mucilaginibacter sp. HD30]
MTTIDLYTGYEGELDDFLRERTPSGTLVFEVHLWHGHFTSVLDWLPFITETHEESVVYNFHTDVDWGDEESECNRLLELYNQLEAIEKDINPLDYDAYIAIKQICNSALQNGNKLYYKN